MYLKFQDRIEAKGTKKVSSLLATVTIQEQINASATLTYLNWVIM